MDKQEIGLHAGMVWHLLNDNAKWSYQSLKRKSGFEGQGVGRSIGLVGPGKQNRVWTARRRFVSLPLCQCLYWITGFFNVQFPQWVLSNISLRGIIVFIRLLFSYLFLVRLEKQWVSPAHRRAVHTNRRWYSKPLYLSSHWCLFDNRERRCRQIKKPMSSPNPIPTMRQPAFNAPKENRGCW